MLDGLDDLSCLVVSRPRCLAQSHHGEFFLIAVLAAQVPRLQEQAVLQVSPELTGYITPRDIVAAACMQILGWFTCPHFCQQHWRNFVRMQHCAPPEMCSMFVDC